MAQDNRLLPVTHHGGGGAERALDRPLSDFTQPAKQGYGAAASEPTHLREYLSTVLKRKWLILSLVVVVTSLVTVQMYRTPSVYEATTTILIEPKRDSPLKTSKDQVVINTGRSVDPLYVNTQLRLLENPALARQVIRTLDLQNNPTFFGGQVQTGFISSLRRIFSREKAPAAAAAEQSGEMVQQGGVPVVTIDQMKAGALTQDELTRLEPYEDTLAANLTVEPITGTNLVSLRYRHTNPDLAQKIADAVADTFIYNNFDREVSGTSTAADKVAKRVLELQIAIRQAEENRVNFATRNDLPPNGNPAENLPAQRLAMLSQQVLTAENERKAAESLYKAASSAADPNDIPNVQDNKRVQDLRKKRDELDQRREELLQIYTAEWPAVKQIDAQIKKLDDSLTKAPREVVGGLKSSYESSLSKERSLKQAYDVQRRETTGQNVAQINLGVINRDLATMQQEYDTLKQRQRELETQNSDRSNNVSVSTYARVPRAPVGPARVRTIVLAFLLSLGAGVGLAFLLDYLDDTLKNADDVDRYIHLPSLALIPAYNEPRPRLKGLGGGAPVPAPAGGDVTALALTADVRSPVAEAYRHLRTSLLLSSAGQPPRTILVTSSQPSEGKTTTAVNTAIMLAQTGADVLIVDCDLRRPRVHANFNVPNARGLTNYLSGERDLDTLMQSYDKLPNLRLLTSGPVPPNPAELLGSNEMRRLLAVLSERFTHIVIDSPPAISFTDASILSTMVDGVMLVVHSGRSSRAVVRRAKQQLVDVGANIFGVVLNNVKLDSPDYAYYGGYYASYYNEYEEEDGDGDGAPADEGAPEGAARRTG